ncbi:hypothetical protein BDZ91DRAFT_768831 [Kalaharituber pfeilii]|nr:hypothetical protein BDZ91DRAFT_768831 [Kalaharituber pfeilii]
MSTEMVAANLTTKVMSVTTIIWSGIDLSLFILALICDLCGTGVVQLLGATIYTIVSTGLFVASDILSHYLLGVPGMKGCEDLDLSDRSSGYGFLWEEAWMDPNSDPTALQHARRRCQSWARHWRMINAVAFLHIFLAIILYASAAYPYLVAGMRFRRRIRERDAWEHTHNSANITSIQPGGSDGRPYDRVTYELRVNSSKEKRKDSPDGQTVCSAAPKLIQLLSIYEIASMIAKESHDADIRSFMLASRVVRDTLVGSTGALRLRQLTCSNTEEPANTTKCWSCRGKYAHFGKEVSVCGLCMSEKKRHGHQAIDPSPSACKYCDKEFMATDRKWWHDGNSLEETQLIIMKVRIGAVSLLPSTHHRPLRKARELQATNKGFHTASPTLLPATQQQPPASGLPPT